MYIVSIVGGLILLALVVSEVQNVVRSLIFAWDWPATAGVRETPSGVAIEKREPLSWRERGHMAWNRMAFGSMLMHQVHCYVLGKNPEFQSLPAMLLAAIVMVATKLVGFPADVAVGLGCCAGALLFTTSQVQRYVRFVMRENITRHKLQQLLKTN